MQMQGLGKSECALVLRWVRSGYVFLVGVGVWDERRHVLSMITSVMLHANAGRCDRIGRVQGCWNLDRRRRFG